MAAAELLDLTNEPIDVGALYDAVRDPGCGAVTCFVGTTRDVHEGRAVARLSYETYEEMAREELGRLASEMRSRYPGVARVAIVHRLGEVPLAEASVVIAVATPHRSEGFEACRWGIDALKERLPVWKKELYADGGAPQWIANAGVAEGGGA